MHHSDMKKREYIKPVIDKIVLDSTITLMMGTGATPTTPSPILDNNNGGTDPFASPFGDKPFN